MGTARLRKQKGGLITYTYTHTVYVSAINRQTDNYTYITCRQDTQTETDRHIDVQTDRQEGKKTNRNRDRQTRQDRRTDSRPKDRQKDR